MKKPRDSKVNMKKRRDSKVNMKKRRDSKVNYLPVVVFAYLREQELLDLQRGSGCCCHPDPDRVNPQTVRTNSRASREAWSEICHVNCLGWLSGGQSSFA